MIQSKHIPSCNFVKRSVIDSVIFLVRSKKLNKFDDFQIYLGEKIRKVLNGEGKQKSSRLR